MRRVAVILSIAIVLIASLTGGGPAFVAAPPPLGDVSVLTYAPPSSRIESDPIVPPALLVLVTSHRLPRGSLLPTSAA